ncbi:30S ribosomal protein S17 [Buchnera aphidicola]|uniref:30S ribosomal protein S17 n=1 Tax=Buchnera aphidicola TaxID=9 RepID=UPI0030EF2D36
MINKKKVFQGIVLSNKMNKSIVVLLERKIKHPIYKKFIRKKTKLHVHDENNECKIGDFVEIVECKPISKTKSWSLKKVLKKNIL